MDDGSSWTTYAVKSIGLQLPEQVETIFRHIREEMWQERVINIKEMGQDSCPLTMRILAMYMNVHGPRLFVPRAISLERIFQ